MSSFRNILWGLVLIAIGVILGLNALDITNISIFFSGWWTLFIIVPSFIDLFKANESKTGNIIGLIIGILLLLACQDVLDFAMLWKLLLPIILVIIGLSCIFKSTINSNINKRIKELNKNQKDTKNYCATFSGQKIDCANEEFTGCTMDAVFGGVTCDLREAKFKEDTIINASAIFGGIDIYVPKNINVKVNSTSIFGGVDNKCANKEDNKVTLYVNATCLFGGVEIK